MSQASADQNKRGPGRPRSVNKRQKREDILLAAIQVFGEFGFDGASLAKIAKLADTDIGLTRYYFGSKDSLWRSCIEHIVQQGLSEQSKIINAPDLSATDKLKQMIRWFGKSSTQWPQLSRFIVSEGNAKSKSGEFIFSMLVGPLFESMEELIKESQQEGGLAEVCPRSAFFLITHGVSFPLSLPNLTNKLPGEDIYTQKGIEKHIDSVIRLLFKD
jgi:AcrR family transcriptional regulator